MNLRNSYLFHVIDSNDIAEIWQNKVSNEYSLHASRTFTAGEVISEFGSSKMLTEPTYLTVQIGEAKHILLSPSFLQYANHSCAPNTFLTLPGSIISL